MVRSNRTAVLYALTLALLPVASGSALAQAQPVVSTSPAGVNIETDKADLLVTLQRFFKTGQVNYVIEPTVKSGTVTVSLHDMAFNRALETLLKASGLPLTYRIEAGVYTVMERQPESETMQTQTTIIRPINASAAAMLALLKNIKRFGPESQLTFTVAQNTDALIVTYPETEEGYNLMRQVESTVRLADVKPKNIGLKVEVIALEAGKSGQTRHTLFTTTARTLDSQLAHIRIGNGGETATQSVEGVETNRFDAAVTPSLNADGTIHLNSNGTLDVMYRSPGEEKPRRMQIDFSGLGNYKANEPVLVHSTILKKQSGKGGEQNLEIEILVTPELLTEDAPPLHPAP